MNLYKFLRFPVPNKFFAVLFIVSFLASPLTMVFGEEQPAADISASQVIDVGIPLSDSVIQDNTTLTPDDSVLKDKNKTIDSIPTSLDSVNLSQSSDKTLSLDDIIKNDNSDLGKKSLNSKDVESVIKSMSTMSLTGSDRNTPQSFNPQDIKKFTPDVDKVNGALNYSYPIDVPSGRLGLSPDIKLNYNSQNLVDQSEYGYGWNINIPFISRLNKHGAEELYTGTYKDFSSSLGGDLTKISDAGTLNADEGIYSQKFDTGDFLKYSYLNNTWKITDKNGTVYTYGSGASGRQDDSQNSSHVYKWMLTEVKDTNNNYITYSYYKDAGQIYIDNITYTNSESTTGIYKVTFVRESLSNVPSTYTPGFLVNTNYRIKDIVVSVNNIDSKKYHLSYTVGQNNTRNILSSVGAIDVATGLTLTTNLSYTTNRNNSYSTGFSSTISAGSDIKINSCSVGSATSMQCGAHFADINGDGLLDYVAAVGDLNNFGTGTYTYNERIKIMFNTGTSFVDSGLAFPSRTLSNYYNLSSSSQSPQHLTFFDNFDGSLTPIKQNNLALVDVNGDGKADLIWQDPEVSLSNEPACANYNPWKVYLNTGSGWAYSSSWNTPMSPTLNCNLDVRNIQFADVNGDGFNDIYIGIDGFYYGGLQQVALLNDHNGHWVDKNWGVDNDGATIEWPAVFLTITGVPDNGFTKFLDINNDSLLDLVVSIRASTREDNSTLPRSGINTSDIGEWYYVFMNTGHYWKYDSNAPQFPSNNLTFSNHVLTYPTSHQSHVVFSGVIDNLQTTYLNNYINNMFDFDGDGQPDLFDDSNDGVVYQSHNNQSWVSDSAFSSAWNSGHPVLANSGTSAGAAESPVLDFNGDGILDYIDNNYLGNPSSSTFEHINTNIQADVLKTITTSTGGTISVTYKPAVQYLDSSFNILNTGILAPLQTVQSITTNDSVSSVSIIKNYTYSGGKHYTDDPYNVKFAGFHSITETDSNGNKTVTYYHQGDNNDSTTYENNDTYSKIGLPYRIEKFDSSGNLYTREIITWDNHNIGTNHDFVKKSKDVLMQYDGTNNHVDTATQYTYDNSNGSVLSQTEWGLANAGVDGTFTDISGDKRSTNYEYAINTANGVVALKHATVSDINSTKVKESKYYYDTLPYGSVGDGNQTKEEKWVTGSTYINSQRSYDGYGLVTSETNPRGKVTSYVYDSYNLYSTAVTDPINHVTSYTYNYAVGKVVTKTDPNSKVWSYVYDGFGRILQENIPDPAGGANSVVKTTYAYNDTSGAVSVKKTDYLDNSNNVDTYQYFDGLGRLIQERKEAEISGDFNVSDTVYNNLGLIQKQSLPYSSLGSSRTSATSTSTLYSNYTHDALGRILTDQNAVGTTSYSYNLWKTSITDPRGKVKDLYNDAYGNLVQVDEHNSGSTYTTTYTYDSKGKLTNITDALGNVRNFTYDGLENRLTAEDLHAPADSTYGSWSYVYDNAGNMTQSVSPNSKTTNYTYDDLNRQLTENYTGGAGTEIIYSYDVCTNGVGKLCSIVMTSGADTSYSYDSNGNVASEAKTIDSDTHTTSYTYDRQGNQLLITYPDNAQAKYTYNMAGLLNQIERKESGGTFTNVISNIDYSPTNIPTLINYVNCTSTTNTYDSTNLYRLSDKKTKIPYSSFVNANPIITLTGSNLINKNIGDTWTEPGYVATDTEDGSLTSSVTITGSVNTGVAGTYQLVYAVVDSQGAPAARVIRTVVVKSTAPSLKVKALTVAGGGGGGSSNSTRAGGAGGAGGYRYDSLFSINAQAYPVTVGNGGAGAPSGSGPTGTNGGNSSFSSITANGGGGGGSYVGSANTGANGGSGGGGSGQRGNGGSGMTGQGNSGGTGMPNGSGGGGGSSTAGSSGSSNINGGAGGNGTANSISGLSVIYAGGGGGGAHTGGAIGSGGTGGGGNGGAYQNPGSAGVNGLGGGGGGAGTGGTGYGGGNGGKGVVIISYRTDGNDGVSSTSTGGTKTTSGGYTIHTFTTSGTFTAIAGTLPTNNNPVITLTGSNLINKNIGDTWTEPGYVATDTEDGSLTSSVTITGSVNTGVAGTYQLVYAVVDSQGAPAARVIRTVFVHSPTINLQNISYTYDPNGNITQIVDTSKNSSSKTVTYTYDDLNRMLSATATNVASGQSTYTQNFTYNAIGNITAGPVGSYTYAGTGYANPHAATSINSVTNTYDHDGNVLTDGTLTNTWNYKDQLIETTNGTFTRDYKYDEGGNRVSSTDGTTTTVYPNKYYNYDGTKKTKSIYMGDTLVATIETVGGTVTPFYNHTDHLNSVTAVSDSSGALSETLDYMPYGAQRISSGSYAGQRQYLSQVFDPDTSLNYLQARFYQNSTGRFISQDPMFWQLPQELLLDPQQQNSYSYSRDNPITNSDPTGNMTVSEAINSINSWLSKIFNQQPQTNPISSPQISNTNQTVDAKNGSVDYGRYTVTSETLRNRLDKFADDTNQNIIVTSGDRTPEGNKSVGGANASRHLSGDAADIKVNGVSNENLSYKANQSGLFNTTIYYPTVNLPNALAPHVHVDLNPSNNNSLLIYSPSMKNGSIINSYKPLANPLSKNNK